MTVRLLNNIRVSYRRSYCRMKREGYFSLYLLLLPSLLVLFVIKYIPMAGIVMAFQDYNIFEGIRGSEWVGFDTFRRVFSTKDFYRVLFNTLYIGLYKTLFWIPLPVIMAIFLNEVGSKVFRRTVQYITNIPHFFSWVIVTGIFFNILSVNGGFVNNILMSMGLEPIRFMYDSRVFREVIVFTSMWRSVGYGSIIYLAALTSIDPQQYEAATIDGASRFRQTLHISLPGIASTIVLMLLLNIGDILNHSFDQIIVMYNPAVYNVADIINTYVFRYGVGQLQYSYATAIGVFNGFVGFVLIILSNSACRKWLDKSMW